MERSRWLVEVRAERNEDGAPTIVGYAAVFDSLSVDFGGWREQIAPGAFAESISRDDIRALWNHDDGYPLGRTTNGTLMLAEDEVGLRVQITPPPVQYARDFASLIENGYVSGMSFGFTSLDDDVTMADDGQLIRVLRKVKLWEVSPVTFPAYPATSVSVRNADSGPFGDKPDFSTLQQRALAQGGDEVRAAQVRRAAQRAREIETFKIIYESVGAGMARRTRR